jgi:hypothetical protein
MIVKLISVIFINGFLLVNGCASPGGNSMQNNHLPQIIINGEKIISDTAMSIYFIGEIQKLVKECDDYYELIVDDRIIESIKKEKHYIEVIYPELSSVETIKFNILKFDRVLIPLSGKFYSGEQVTFFTGINGYNNTPVLNRQGISGLDMILNKIKQ